MPGTANRDCLWAQPLPLLPTGSCACVFTLLLHLLFALTLFYIRTVQGELFSTAYFDGLAAEVDETLQEAGVVAGVCGVPAACRPLCGHQGV